MEKIHIEKNTVQETLVIPLYARKLCTERFPGLFCDKKAAELINRIDYDFTEIEKKSESLMQRFGALEVAMRQTDLAFEVQDYLKQHPKAAVVNLGCGLDQTAENCDNGLCRIYNVDYCDVISVRNRLLPETDRVKIISSDLNDTHWLEQIDAKEGCVLFASGVFYYFRTEQIKRLFTEMSKCFRGGTLVFDTCGKFGAKMLKKTWLKEYKIQDVDAFFYVNSIQKDVIPWIRNAKVTSRGYMLGYHDLQDESVSRFFRFLSKIGDRKLHMQIVRIDFEN